MLFFGWKWVQLQKTRFNNVEEKQTWTENCKYSNISRQVVGATSSEGFSSYRQHCAQRKAPVFKLLRGGRLLRAKFHPHRYSDKAIGPTKWNCYWDLIKM